jgi:hypothetical protein
MPSTDVKWWQYVICGIVAFLAGGAVGGLVQIGLRFKWMQIALGSSVSMIIMFYVFSVMEDVFLMHNLSKEERNKEILKVLEHAMEDGNGRN